MSTAMNKREANDSLRCVTRRLFNRRDQMAYNANGQWDGRVATGPRMNREGKCKHDAIKGECTRLDATLATPRN